MEGITIDFKHFGDYDKVQIAAAIGSQSTDDWEGVHKEVAERIGILAEFPFAPEDLTYNFLQL